jgi:phosphate transport system permease protein
LTTLAPPPIEERPPPPRLPPVPRRIGRPIRPRDFKWSDAGLLVASALSSFALVWVIFYQLTLFSGIFGFLLCWYAGFLALYWMVTAQTLDRQAATDRVVAALMVTGAAIVFGLVVFIVGWVAWKGVPHLSANLFVKDQKAFIPADPNILHKIGVAHAIVGTAEEVGLAALIGVPVAILTAIFLNEVKGRGVTMVRTVVTAMSGLPSIVAGVFIYSIFVETNFFRYAGFLAALALFILLLPSVTRTTEEVLRIVPGGLREASLALGATEFRTVCSVVLPTALSGIITASLLGVAIAVGETAPLLFTSFGSNVMNANAFHGAQAALPLVIFDNVRQAQAVLIDLAYATAFILLALVLVLFVLARVLGRKRARTGAWKERLHALRGRMRPAPIPSAAGSSGGTFGTHSTAKENSGP